MILKLFELYSLLSDKQKKSYLKIQILVVLMSFLEVVSVLSIGPFMTLVGDVGVLEDEEMLNRIYIYSGFGSPEEFLFLVGVIVFIVLLIASLISMYITWTLSIFGAFIGSQLANRLFTYYMHQPWIFHTSGNSSILIKQISYECHRIIISIIRPVLFMNAKLCMSFFLIITLFVYNFSITVIGLAVFIAIYLIIYKFVQNKLSDSGKAITQSQAMRFKLMAEGFGGIKDTIILGRELNFIRQFEEQSELYAKSQGLQLALSQVPRYLMELVAYGSVIILVLVLMLENEANLSEILPILSVFTLAGFKLLPAFQIIYTSIAQVRGNITAYESIRNEMIATVNIQPVQASKIDARYKLSDHIEFRNVSFTYPNKEKAAINNLSFKISVNKAIGLIGKSGVGKSTLVDLLLGLIEPDCGSILIDGRPLSAESKRQWQNSLGYVAQSLYLAETTIRENIAFGLPEIDIDEEKIQQVANLAHLDELLNSLPFGLNTVVGERGIQLSGGQKQRIGIARALYCGAEILIFDEATSALDGITEKIVMDTIQEFGGKKTIIIVAHRLGTLKKCDCIYLMENGQIVDSGSYKELSKQNMVFRQMAQSTN